MGGGSLSTPTLVRWSRLLRYLFCYFFCQSFKSGDRVSLFSPFFFLGGRGKGGKNKKEDELRRSTAMSTLVLLPQRSCHILYA